MSTAALAAPKLTCNATMYKQATQVEVDCGPFVFNLPVDSEYVYGKGECRNVRMYTSISTGRVEKDAFAVTLIGQHPVDPEDFATTEFEGEFPKDFAFSATAKERVIYYVRCSRGT